MITRFIQKIKCAMGFHLGYIDNGIYKCLYCPYKEGNEK